MDPTAIDAVINQCRTGQDAVKVYREAIVKAGGEEPTRTAAGAALLEAVRTSGWALLVAPELHAAYQEWLACNRFEDDLEGLRHHRDIVGVQMREPSSWRVVEIDKGAKFGDGVEVFNEVKIGPDVLSVRAAAYAKMAAEITRAEEAYARARSRFVKSVYAYQRSMEPLRGLQPKDLAKLILSQSYREGDLAIARAAIDEGPAALQSGSVDRVMASLRSRLLDRSAP